MMIYRILFLFIHEKYKKWGEKDIPGLYALAFNSLLVYFNLFFLDSVLYELNITDKLYMDEAVSVVVLLLILSLMHLYLYAFRKRYNKQPDTLANYTKTQKTLSAVYVLFSIISYVFSLLM